MRQRRASAVESRIGLGMLYAQITIIRLGGSVDGCAQTAMWVSGILGIPKAG